MIEEPTAPTRLAPALGSGMPSTTEDEDFLRHRVGVFGLVGFLVGIVFWTFRLVVMLVAEPWRRFDDLSFWFHLGGALSFLGVWLTVRFRTWSRAALVRIETSGLLSAVIFYSAMGLFIPIEARPDFVVLLALTFAMILRAVFVPTRTGQTALVTAAAGIPIVAMVYLSVESAIAADTVYLQSTTNPHGAITFSAGVWWSLTVLSCTAVSRVIYGLRREASAARKLGQYTLGDKIGAGGMGAVYRASHARLRRPTAIKLMHQDDADPERYARFEREAQATASLRSPHSVEIYDFGRSDDGTVYFVMELLDGLDFEQFVDQFGPLPPNRGVRWLKQVCHSLTEAHAIGLVHRDIKPSNILVTRQGLDADFIKVVDFGLVKALEKASTDVTRTGSSRLPRGTPAFMAPETAMGEELDHRADLYSLGCVAFWLLTGHRPFEGSTPMKVIMQHVNEPPPNPADIAEMDLPEALNDLILELLAKAPADRPDNIASVDQRLSAIEDELADPWTQNDARRWWEQHKPARLPGEVASAPTLTA